MSVLVNHWQHNILKEYGGLVWHELWHCKISSKIVLFESEYWPWVAIGYRKIKCMRLRRPLKETCRKFQAHHLNIQNWLYKCVRLNVGVVLCNCNTTSQRGCPENIWEWSLDVRKHETVLQDEENKCHKQFTIYSRFKDKNSLCNRFHWVACRRRGVRQVSGWGLQNWYLQSMHMFKFFIYNRSTSAIASTL